MALVPVKTTMLVFAYPSQLATVPARNFPPSSHRTRLLTFSVGVPNCGLLDEFWFRSNAELVTFADKTLNHYPAIHFRDSAGFLDEWHRASTVKRATFAGKMSLENHRAGTCGENVWMRLVLGLYIHVEPSIPSTTSHDCTYLLPGRIKSVEQYKRDQKKGAQPLS
jgi:hypothetical protein